MTRVYMLLISVCLVSGQVPPASRDVLTHHNDKYRSAVYSAETSLTPTTVNSKSFGKIFARRVQGQIWGQPLYVHGVPVNGKPRNVVYVATSENLVYGFDADDRSPDEGTTPLASRYLGRPRAIDSGIGFLTIFPSNGVSGTPVIDLGVPPDPANGILYVLAKLDHDDKFHIFALELASLAIRTSVVVTGKAPGQGNSTVSFDSDKDHLARSALLISGNHLVVAFGSGPKNDWDFPNYHGWVMSYSLPGLAQTGVYVTTPSDTGMGAIWQSGNGPAADDQGNVYVMTGNGPFQSTKPLPDLTNAFVKLSNSDGWLRLADWYSPPSRNALNDCDLDLGSSGPAVIQDAGKVLGVGKSGILYVLNKDNMGRTEAALPDFHTWRGTPDCISGQCFRVAENLFQPPGATKQPCHGNMTDNNGNWQQVVDSYPHVHGAPAIWKLGSNNFNLYVWPEQDDLKAYHFDGQHFSSTPVGSSAPISAAMMSMPGGVLSISWNGVNPSSGILWAARPNPAPAGFAVGNPFVSVFNNQQHFVFRNRDGTIWDSYFVRALNLDGSIDTTNSVWHSQAISTAGNPAVGDAFVSVFTMSDPFHFDQQHFVYLDRLGHILDSFYVRSANSWRFQTINTAGHAVAGKIVVSAFYDQQHFAWIDAAGAIWDSYYVQNDGWHVQQINTNNHPAAGSLFISVFDAAAQQHFVYTDAAKNVWDSYYVKGDGWHYQQVDTHGHVPVGDVFVSAFYDQQHFAWIDAAGAIWDSYYIQNHGWHFQQINTNGHPAAGNLFISVFASAAQQHFVYTDAAKNVWDSFYVKGQNWRFQQIQTSGHTPVSSIFVSDFFDQQHFVWIDNTGNVWDSFYSQQGNDWQTQTLSSCMYQMSRDLTPNNAPCNGINKTVRGYIQAFAAVPQPNGQLAELWTSEQNQTDSVLWFAKQSPPTIADGKVFVVEFPPPTPGGDWATSSAFGRLIVYSRR